MQQNVLQKFFLRMAPDFDHEIQIPRQTLARRHPDSHPGFFRRGIELNNDRLFFLVVEQGDRFAR